jgi:GAF domain-containing protein
MTGVAPGVTIAWFVFDVEANRLVLADSAGSAAGDLAGLTLKIGDGVSGWVAAQRQAIVNSEAALDLGSRVRSMRTPLESCLSVPLIAGDTLAGVVTLYSAAQSAFSEDQSRLIQVIAPHMAQALIKVKRNQAAEPVVRGRSERELRLVNSR